MSQQTAGYRGEGFSLRGEKDRFVLPPMFRKTFEALGDDRVLCVTTHHKYPCLTAFGHSSIDKFEDILNREEDNAVRRDLDFDRDEREMQLYSHHEVPFDGSGRFILPPRYCKVGGISHNICFIGGGTFITLWDLDRLGQMGGSWALRHELFVAEAEDARAKAAAKAARK
ncbi:division/cell wall cluster transcriptional repressor MraZ [Aurantiacibacter sediminis]|uniref:Division/cell wall cluster transcriptional repressor MraZ n=1 Tax=Aurantiacibacter sediminis TaxID=2793064 RepID=A0ABS0N678_9SPHN|nr:division/cell wall cluster transcriptional repressor MraZ [Aurantiacibacter sediminis]MBH5323288.1 division/cell wall cluster transcriptional repressor MraZ [Aurantiacibacter sediminis]